MPSKSHGKFVTPQTRVAQQPDEFIIKSNQLFCKWCDRSFTSLRNDNLKEHLHSIIHQENRLRRGAKMSYNPVSCRVRRKNTDDKNEDHGIVDYYTSLQSSRRKMKETLSEDSSDDSSSNSSNKSQSDSEEQLSQIFEQSDSDDTESFQGFDELSSEQNDSDTHNQRDSESGKRSSHWDDSSEEPPRKIKRTKDSFQRNRQNSQTYASSIPIRNMPLKKQISHNARSSFSPPDTKKGNLKIKIRRQPIQHSSAFQVESSENDDIDSSQEDRRITSYKGTGDGLKMKFVLNKKSGHDSESATPSRHRRKFKKRKSNVQHDTSFEEESHGGEAMEVYPPSPPMETKIPLDYENNESFYDGVEEVIEEEVVQDDAVEVVEEEIVGVDDGEVVSWDAVVGEEDVEEEEEETQSVQPPSPTELSSEQSLAIKANYAREMAKAVNSAQFKKKRMVSKKYELKGGDKEKEHVVKEKQKRKVSGYNLWSSKMRKQVTLQYPGLQFGDVSKKLGDLWKRIPDKEKQMWKHRSDKMANQLEERHSCVAKRNKGSKMIETGPKKKIVSPKPVAKSVPLGAFPPHKNPQLTMEKELQKLPVPTLEPIDAAAHLHLLAQSLTNIGKQVKAGGSITSTEATSSLLLDTLLCSLTPLLTLMTQVPQLEGSIPDNVMISAVSNIAHIMPGF